MTDTPEISLQQYVRYVRVRPATIWQIRQRPAYNKMSDNQRVSQQRHDTWHTFQMSTFNLKDTAEVGLQQHDRYVRGLPPTKWQLYQRSACNNMTDRLKVCIQLHNRYIRGLHPTTWQICQSLPPTARQLCQRPASNYIPDTLKVWFQQHDSYVRCQPATTWHIWQSLYIILNHFYLLA